MYKIGFVGAHGTGKTTLVNSLAPKLKLALIDKTIRNMWAKFGIADFDKCPPDVRTVFQNYLLLGQIEREETEGAQGFLADRTVLDVFIHTVVFSDMQSSHFQLYEALVKERIAKYTHVIYCPIEFAVENEELRANIDSREVVDQKIQEYLNKWFKPGQFLTVTGSVEQREEQIMEFLKR